MKKTFLLTTVLGLLLFTTQSSFSPVDAPDLVKDVLHYTNKFRKSNRLAELKINAELNAIAQKHSENMAKGRVRFGHDGFDQRMKKARKAIGGMHTFAENVAYGARSGKEVVSMWKNSAGHRQNMLGNYRYIGIGTAKDKRGKIYYTEVFAN